MSLSHQIKLFFKSNIVRTIWFNIKMFPFSVAIKMPVFLFGKVTFRSLQRGGFVLKTRPFPGMITIGREGCYVANSKPHCQWTVKGKIVFNGPVRFGGGSYVTVAKNAVLTIGTHGTYIGSNVVIICFDSITIGDKVDVAWQCQIIDTSFHYIESVDSSVEPQPLTKPVIVGDRVWVGNRTTISRGAVIPSDNIIASNSLINKDFSEIGPYHLLAGCPAVVKLSGVNRIRGDWEKELDAVFGYDRTTHL